MNVHCINQCRHGVIVAQCRCPAAAKPVTVVNCPTSCYVEGRAYGPDTSIKSQDEAPPTMADRVGYGIKAARDEMLRTGSRLFKDGVPVSINDLIEVAVKAALRS